MISDTEYEFISKKETDVFQSFCELIYLRISMSEFGEHLVVLYQDEDYVAISKPHGLMVHRSPMAANTDRFALQELRNQLDRHVYPAHRLDRKTSGVLIFALHEEALHHLRIQFEKQQVHKNYLSIVRGFTEQSGTIDYALTNDKGKVQEAVTHYQTLGHAELGVPFGKHATSRYSLVSVQPETGRMHQIRKHFAHIFHPIIGDRPHGCNKQNKLFLEKWKMNTMLLHAESLEFYQYRQKQKVKIHAAIQPEFKRMMTLMGFRNQF